MNKIELSGNLNWSGNSTIGFAEVSTPAPAPTDPYFLLSNTPTTGLGGVYTSGNVFLGKFSSLVGTTYTTATKFTGYYVDAGDNSTLSAGTIRLVNPAAGSETFRISSLWPVNFWDPEYGILDSNGYDDVNLLQADIYDSGDNLLVDLPIFLQYLFGPSNPNWSQYRIGTDPTVYYDVSVDAATEKYLTFSTAFPVEPGLARRQNLISYTYLQVEIL
jgi:hypothetical protein